MGCSCCVGIRGWGSEVKGGWWGNGELTYSLVIQKIGGNGRTGQVCHEIPAVVSHPPLLFSDERHFHWQWGVQMAGVYLSLSHFQPWLNNQQATLELCLINQSSIHHNCEVWFDHSPAPILNLIYRSKVLGKVRKTQGGDRHWHLDKGMFMLKPDTVSNSKSSDLHSWKIIWNCATVTHPEFVLPQCERNRCNSTVFSPASSNMGNDQVVWLWIMPITMNLVYDACIYKCFSHIQGLIDA